jgi:hypothetical protein
MFHKSPKNIQASVVLDQNTGSCKEKTWEAVMFDLKAYGKDNSEKVIC